MGARAALTFLTLINVLNYIDRYLIAAVMPVMSHDLQLTNTQAGLAMSAFMLGYFLTSPFFGYIADRYKRTHVIAAGTTVWSLVTGLAGLAQTSTQVILSRIIVGVGEASTVPTSQSLLTDFYPPKKRNQIMAIFSAAIPVGAALGFILGGLLAHHFGWRQAFFFAGMPGLVLAFSVYLLKEPPRGGADAAQAQLPQSFKKDILSLMKNKPYMAAVYGYAAYTFCLGGLAAWIPQYLVRVKNIPLTQADTVFGAITVLTGVFGSLFGGWYAGLAVKKKSRGDMEFVYMLVAVALPLGFLCFFLESVVAFYVAVALFEFLLFASQPTVSVVVMEVVNPAIRTTALAFCVFVIHLLGDLLSPSIVGILADWTQLQWAVLVLPVALIPSALFYRRAYLHAR